MKRLENRVAIVTGAAQGLGEAIAARLAREGCSAVLLADMNIDKAQSAATSIAEEYGIRTLAQRVNVADAEQVEAMVALAHETFGSVDILVANAGILKAHDILEFPAAEWRTGSNQPD